MPAGAARWPARAQPRVRRCTRPAPTSSSRERAPRHEARPTTAAPSDGPEMQVQGGSDEDRDHGADREEGAVGKRCGAIRSLGQDECHAKCGANEVRTEEADDDGWYSEPPQGGPEDEGG